MANSLTGDFDAVVQVRIAIVNGLLATLHRNGGSEAKTPSLLHSFALPIGGGLEVPAEARQIVAWAQSHRFATSMTRTRAEALQVSPPGVYEEFQEAARQFEAAEAGSGDLMAVRGRGQIQASTPTVTFPVGSTSAVTVSFPASSPGPRLPTARAKWSSPRAIWGTSCRPA